MSTTRYEGYAVWNAHAKSDRTTSDIHRAIRRVKPDGVELVLDIDTPFGPYIVSLHERYGLQGTGELAGSWIVGSRNGACTATLYDAGKGDLFLFGGWTENGEDYDWWADLGLEDDAS